jgi:hypothetical protein
MEKIKIISFRIIALFVIAILVSFIPDYLHNFFGDWLCEGAKYGKLIPETDACWSHYELIGCDYGSGVHNPTLHWGYRHWLFFAMGVILFIIQAIDIIIYINKQDK